MRGMRMIALKAQQGLKRAAAAFSIAATGNEK
jgi:hypothetical protein